MPGSHSYVSDPNWNFRHLEQLNQVLDAWTRRRQLEQQKKEARFAESLDLATRAVERGVDPRDPSVQGVFAEYDRRNPEAARVWRATLEASAGRTDKTKRAEAAYETLQKNAEQERMMQLLTALGGTPPMLANDAAYGSAEAEVKPMAELLQTAMRRMPIDQQLAALPQLQQAGVDMNVAAPSSYDKYGPRGLPPVEAALEAAREGLVGVGGDTMQGLRYSAKLDRTPQELASERLQQSQQAIAEQRQALAQKREARLARGPAAGAGDEKEARREAKEREDLINAAAKGLRQDAIDQRTMGKAAGTTGAKLPPIPNFRDARREAVRQEAATLSPRLQGALEALGGVKQQLGEQIGKAGALEVVVNAGRPVPDAQRRMTANARSRQVLPAIEKAETAALDMVAAGKDPDVVAAYIEELLAQLQP